MGNGFVIWFSRWYKGIIIGLATFGVAMLVVLAMQHVSGSAVAGETAGPIPTFTSTPDVRPVAAFLGDSYTHGTGASSPAKRWTSIVAAKEGWQEVNDGEGGTGYVATSGVEGCGQTVCPAYADRVSDLVKQQPDVVVVAGGQNDFGKFGNDPEGVTAAVNDVYSALRAALPHARIIAVGPSIPSDVDAPATGLDRAVRDASKSIGATYVSLLDPDVITPNMLRPDKQHVEDDGHAAIAARVIAALN